jgi:16S rRNA (uracil1498-N3)-methyltransferase
MHRFFLPPEECRSGELKLAGPEAHHAAGVLRLRRDDPVVVLDGAGQVIECTVREVARKSVMLAVQRRTQSPPPPWQITLFQAVPKGKTMDFIVQKATELGAGRIVPILSERVNVHYEERDKEPKRLKWQNIAIEAIKQCGQPWLPQIDSPASLKHCLDSAFDLSLVAALHRSSRHPRGYFERFRAGQMRPLQTVALWIGPEGDFTIEEIQQITAAGGLPITLGGLVLRAETAAVYCLSVARYELESFHPVVSVKTATGAEAPSEGSNVGAGQIS